MEIKCPKCNSEKVFKRNAVPRIETHRIIIVKGVFREVRISEPKFYICYQCWNKFNIK